jgi:hypothetical protein
MCAKVPSLVHYCVLCAEVLCGSDTTVVTTWRGVLGPRAVVRALRQGRSQAEPADVICYGLCYLLLPHHVTSPAASGLPGPHPPLQWSHKETVQVTSCFHDTHTIVLAPMAWPLLDF